MLTQTIKKGSTHRLSLRWATPKIIYKTISHVNSAAPVRMTVTGHGMPDGWRFSVTGIVGGGSELNSKHVIPRAKETYVASVIDANTIEINSQNGSLWPAYVSGGILQYNLPLDLTGCTARLQVRPDPASPVLLFELSTGNGKITIDEPNGKTIATFSPDDTSHLFGNIAYFDMDITFPNGDVFPYPTTKIKLVDEVTR